MKITIEFDSPDGYGETEKFLSWILMDALAEFQSARHGDYVYRRYPHMTPEWQDQKIKMTHRRILWAEAMRNGDINLIK